MVDRHNILSGKCNWTKSVENQVNSPTKSPLRKKQDRESDRKDCNSSGEMENQENDGKTGGIRNEDDDQYGVYNQEHIELFGSATIAANGGEHFCEVNSTDQKGGRRSTETREDCLAERDGKAEGANMFHFRYITWAFSRHLHNLLGECHS